MIKEVKTITPDEAAKILETNIHNRPISRTMVKMMESDIITGNMSADNAKFALNPDGTLYAGQHILAAIVSAGIDTEVEIWKLEKENEIPRASVSASSKYHYM